MCCPVDESHPLRVPELVSAPASASGLEEKSTYLPGVGEVFPNSPSALKALSSPCSAPRLYSTDPSILHTRVSLPQDPEPRVLTGKGDIQFLFALGSKYLLNEGRDFLAICVIRGTVPWGHHLNQNNACSRTCLFLWPVYTCVPMHTLRANARAHTHTHTMASQRTD